jgi:hypothetical protein
MAENERLWKEEKGTASITGTDASGELRSVGISAAGIDSDLELGDTSAPDDIAPPDGAAPPGADMGAGATAAAPAAPPAA